MFCNFLLADEINRAPAKVQSALLEVMQERQVTIGHTTFPVPAPFLVMATQNPIESEGTYPLPEAQIDRFMLKVVIGYPEHDEELTIVQRQLVAAPELREALTLDELEALQAAVFGVYVDPSLVSYAVSLADATRQPAAHGIPEVAEYIAYGASPRGPISLVHGVEGPRAHPWPRLRPRRGPPRAREGRDAPPSRPHLPGARRGGEPRQHPRLGPRGRSRAAGRPRADERCMSTAQSLARVPTPDRPGPGPMPDALLRALDVQIGRKMQGLLAGDYRSARLGDGTELAQIRPYADGDDVRRIDWNVTARTGEPHVRVHVAERVLATWLVLDTSPSMQFGTADRRKADVAEGVAIAVGHVATRRGNRLGVVSFGDADPRTIPPRQGRVGLVGLLAALRAEEEAETKPVGATSLGEALARTGSAARQRALVVIVSDFRGAFDWRRPMLELAGGHDVLAVEIRDPREQELPNAGELWLVDPETGRQLRVDTRDAKLRARFAAAAAEERSGLARTLELDRRPPRRPLDLGRLAPVARRLPQEDEQVTFSSPLWLLALLIVPALVVGYILRERKRASDAARFASPALLPNVVDTGPGSVATSPSSCCCWPSRSSSSASHDRTRRSRCRGRRRP